MSASRSQPIGRAGLAMSLSTPKSITLTVGGVARSVTTSAPTVGQLLAEQNLQVRPLDRLSASVSAPVVAGLKLTLTRIDHRRMTAREAVQFATGSGTAPRACSPARAR